MTAPSGYVQHARQETGVDLLGPNIGYYWPSGAQPSNPREQTH